MRTSSRSDGAGSWESPMLFRRRLALRLLWTLRML
jgi:hypothetical protein